ncbi:MAG: EFR1 family ferrodoxin [Lachnospiraceae bacterium]
MILYFSGTGNSEYVARHIGAAIGDEVVSLFNRLKNNDYIPIESEMPYVIVCPTYAWQIPRILQAWLVQTELRGSKKIYFVLTCGDGVGDAAGAARKLCEVKGLEFMGLAGVKMPENYVAMFPVPNYDKAVKIVKRAGPRIDSIAKAIGEGKPFPDKSGLIGKMLTGPVNKFFYSICISDKKFYVKDKCTGCGLCGENCPMSNIEIKGGRPVWKGNCTHCMACICRCPTEAIEYGMKSRGKPRYTCPKV